MTARMQAIVALALAAGLHLAAMAVVQTSGSATSSGAAGESLLSLQPADGAIADLVAAWDRPPDVQPDIAMPEPPAPPHISDAPPPLPRAALDQDRPANRVAALPQAPTATDTPLTADATRPPAPVAEAVATLRPKIRPARPDPRPATQRAAVAPAPPAQSRPAQAQPAQAPQQAAGAGQTDTSGDQGQARAATAATAAQSDLVAGWGATIRNRIEGRKTYPPSAGRAAGRVGLRLTVHRSGQLVTVAVATSSGHAALDQAALRAVTSAGRFPAAPQGVQGDTHSFALPMSFSR